MSKAKALLDPRTVWPHHPGDPLSEYIQRSRSKDSQDISNKIFPYQSEKFESNKFFNPVRGFLTPKGTQPKK